MKKRMIIPGLSVALLLGSLTTAGAENQARTVTLTPFLGGYTFDGEQHLDTMPVFGVRGGYNFTERFGTELVFDYVSTDGTKFDADTDVYNYHLDLLYHFFPTARAVPFLMAGVGGITLDGPTTDKTRFTFNYGLGLKYALTDRMNLRGEVRHILYRYDQNSYSNVEYGLGLGFLFGAAQPAPKPVAAAAAEPAAPAPAPKPAPAAPRGSISVTPSSAVKGTSATVAWECLDSDAADIQPGIGAVAPRGTKSVTASDSTEYTVTCSGPGGKATASSRLSVSEAPRPACTITATPESITEGQASRLDWECTNTTATEIQPEIGQVAPKGTRTVTPAATTSYSVTGSSGGTSATGTATVKVTPLPPEKRNIVLDVHFDTGKAAIKKSYHDEIGRVAAFLKEYPGVTGTIEGHTDNVGSHDMNLKLSQRRAEAVLDYLVDKYGIERTRLKAVGYGPDRPIASNETAAGRAKNRRTVASFETVVPRKK